MYKLGHIIPYVIAASCKRHGVLQHKIVVEWRNIVGKEMADICMPLEVRFTASFTSSYMDVSIEDCKTAPQKNIKDVYCESCSGDNIDSSEGRGDECNKEAPCDSDKVMRKVQRGTLVIGVNNPGYIVQLHCSQNMILDRLALYFGYRAITRIKFVYHRYSCRLSEGT